MNLIAANPGKTTQNPEGILPAVALMLLLLPPFTPLPAQPEKKPPGTATRIRDRPGDIRNTRAIGGGLSSRSAAFPAADQALEENFYARFSLDAPEMSDSARAAPPGRLDLLLESRRQAQPVSVEPGFARRESSHILASGQLSLAWFYLAAGRRYLPGPGRTFLTHDGYPTSLATLPPARRRGSVFAHIPLAPLSPGLFGLEGVGGGGFYITDPHQRFLLAYHPGARVGAFSGKSGAGDRPGRLEWLWDLERNPRTTTGFARLRLRPVPPRPIELAESSSEEPVGRADSERWDFLVEADRREAWDYLDFAAGELAPGRAGKSGRGYGRVAYHSRLFLEAGGQDIKTDGMRFGRTGLMFQATGRRGGLGVDGSLYRSRIYSDDDGSQYLDSGPGIFWALRRPDFHLLIRAEGRHSGFASGEAMAGLQAGKYRFQISGIFRARQAPVPEHKEILRQVLTQGPLANGMSASSMHDPNPPSSAPEQSERPRDSQRRGADSSTGTDDLPEIILSRRNPNLWRELRARRSAFHEPPRSPRDVLKDELRSRWRRSLWPAAGRVDRAFLFQKVATEGESGARFYGGDTDGVVRLRLAGPSLYFLLQSTVTGSRPRVFTRVQFETRF